MNAEHTADVIDTADEFQPIGTASYSVEDNKIRIYAFARLDTETFERVKAAGYKWAPKQECFVAPMWTPAREDLALELCGEMDDEDYSATERAADRAERFGDYRDKRAAEAGVSADAFEAGPSAFGHQNRQRAERQARRHDRKRTYAVSQWSKAEYWQERTASVIAHALHKADPRTRRGRIKTLEAEQRKHEKERAEYATRYAAWAKVPTLDGANQPGEYVSGPTYYGFKEGTVTESLRLAYNLANYGSYGDYTHPRTGRQSSLYSLLTDGADPITPAEAAALWLAGKPDPEQMGKRWADHYENRLTYERAMLANEGGTAADVEMVPGGWVKGATRTSDISKNVNGGWMQIHAVTRSPVTKKVTSVKVMGTVGYRDPKPGLVSVNVERLGEGCYRAPTAEELAEFLERSKAEKAEKKATAPKAPALINPTDADAEKLQAEWNRLGRESHKRRGEYGEYKDSPVWYMTQAEYGQRSKGSYGVCETSDISERLMVRRQTAMGSDVAGRVTVFKVRTGSSSGFNSSARRVVVITDKPQKPLPWMTVQVVRGEQPTEAKVFPRLGELAEAMRACAGWEDRMPATASQLLEDAIYLGWAYSSSLTQFGFTPAGQEQFKKFEASNSDAGILATV